MRAAACMTALFIGCTASPESADLSRLDACLRALVETGREACTYTPRGEGRYAVIIHSDSLAALDEFGIPTGSALGSVVTASVTIDQLSRISRVAGVLRVENPAQATPHR